MSGLSINVEIPAGELIDKITILEIKNARVTDAAKRANVAAELATLQKARDGAVRPSDELESLSQALRTVNEKLWDIEDEIRDKERAKAFDDEFIALARAVYRTNDERAALKRAINEHLGSRLIEEKSYAAY